MTKKVDTWMPLLVDKYLGDTTHLTTEQHGAYLLLLMAMWKSDGRLPNDDEQLRAITRLERARWRVFRPVLMALLRANDGDEFVTQKRLSEELARSKEIVEKKSGAGKAGAAKRWKKDASANGAGNGTQDDTGIADALANGQQEAWQTGAPTPTPIQALREAEHAYRPDTARAPDEEPPGNEAGTAGAPPPTPAGAVCRAMRRAGLAETNPGDPRLLALLEQGATEAEFAGIAAEAVAKGKGWAWVLAVLQARRAEAAAIRLAPPPAERSGNVAAEQTQAWLAEQRANAERVEAERQARIAQTGSATPEAVLRLRQRQREERAERAAAAAGGTTA